MCVYVLGDTSSSWMVSPYSTYKHTFSPNNFINILDTNINFELLPKT